MEYYHDQHIGVYKKSIPDEWCNKIIEYFENNSSKTHQRKGIFGPDSIRDTSTFLPLDNPLVKEFHKYFSKVINLYKYKYPSLFPYLEINNYKIQKTLPTEGYHPYHIEQGPTFPEVGRIAVYTIYLNDVEEGGETEFLYQLKRVKPQKGTVCIFPAGYTHVHRGNTPFSGEKYIMTGWLETPLTNNINK